MTNFTQTFKLILVMLLSVPSFLQAQDCKALCNAIENDDLSQAQELISKGLSPTCTYTYKYSPKFRNPYFRTKSYSAKRIQSPIHFIAKANVDYSDWINLFKNQGVDLNTKDNANQTVLHLAAETKNEELIQHLLDADVDVNIIDKSKNSPLVLMIDGETSLEIIQQVIDKGSLVAQSLEVNSALFQAFKHNNFDIANFLLRKGASIHESSKQGTTCIEAAIENQNIKMTKLALSHGADVRKANMKTLTNESLIKLLIEKGANVNAVDLNNIIAYGGNNKELVRWLLKNGANANQKGYLSQTPLYHAIRKNDLELVKILVKAGANLNHDLTKDENYLTIATQNQQLNKELIQFLINHKVHLNGLKKSLAPIFKSADKDKIQLLIHSGLDISKVKITDVSSVDFAEYLLTLGANIKNINLESIVKSGNVDMMHFLLNKGINLEARNAIYLAVKNQQTPILNFLLKEKYTPNLMFKDGKWQYSPLMKAIQNNDLLSVTLLIEAGANINAMNNKGETVLGLAILNKNDKILNYLLDNNIDFSKKNEKNNIALVKTCIENNFTEVLQRLIDKGLNISELSLVDFIEDDNTNTIKILLAHNVDIEAPNKNGHSPLYVAFKKRYYDTVTLLLERNANINSICLAEYMTQQVRLDHLAIQFLVENEIEINKKCDRKHTPLHIAIQKEDLKMVKYLIANGANTSKAYRYAKKSTTSQPIIDYLKDTK